MSATLSESSPRVQSCSPVTNPVHQTEMAQIFSKNSTYCASILSFDYILLLQISGFECIFTSEQNGITNEAIFLESYTAQCKMLLLHAKNVRESQNFGMASSVANTIVLRTEINGGVL